MHFSLLRCTRTVNFTDVIFLSLPKRKSFLFSVYRNDATSGVAKVLKDPKEVLGETESRSSNLADKLTHVGRHGNNYSSRGRVGGGGGGKGKENLLSRLAPSPHESREVSIIPLIFLSP